MPLTPDPSVEDHRAQFPGRGRTAAVVTLSARLRLQAQSTATSGRGAEASRASTMPDVVELTAVQHMRVGEDVGDRPYIPVERLVGVVQQAATPAPGVVSLLQPEERQRRTAMGPRRSITGKSSPRDIVGVETIVIVVEHNAGWPLCEHLRGSPSRGESCSSH